MKVTSVSVGIYTTNCYIIEGDSKDGKFCIVLDPGDNADLILSKTSTPVTHIILTHSHFDHLLALADVMKACPSAKLCYSSYEDVSPEFLYSVASTCRWVKDPHLTIPKADILLSDSDLICGFKVLWTPGHTHGSICLYNKDESVLFSGDTLFCHGFGRTDLGGSRHDIVASLKTLFSTLPPETVVYPGHGSCTTIGSEKEYYHQ